jgi:AcrR family transcriptional regulator
MSKADRTRLHIIERTAPLFNRQGFDGTSLADLTQATGLTKGALYGNFRDKEQIGREAFQFAIRKVKQAVKMELEGLSTYKEQLLALLGFYSKYVMNPPVAGGCPLLNTAIEADDHHLSMRRVVVKELVSTIQFISDLIQKGIEAKEFKAGINPVEIAYVIFCSVEGALMFSRVERSTEPMEIIVRHCHKIINQISK